MVKKTSDNKKPIVITKRTDLLNLNLDDYNAVFGKLFSYLKFNKY